MIRTALLVCIFPLFLSSAPIASAANQKNDGFFLIGDRAIKIEELKRRDLVPILEQDWTKFDIATVATKNFFTGQPETTHWYYQVTPPIPTYWPPQQKRSITYYAYAEYQEFMRHGPLLSRTAPWAKVVLNEGAAAENIVLAIKVGPVAHQYGSSLQPPSVQERMVQVRRDGEKLLSSFVSWKAIPDKQEEVNAIREYYCQWAQEDGTAKLIQKDHQEFFEWLSCPH
jgi:hypothetical protein